MPDEEDALRDALHELERELDRMMNIGEVQQANALVAAICARFAIETARIAPASNVVRSSEFPSESRQAAHRGRNS